MENTGTFAMRFGKGIAPADARPSLLHMRAMLVVYAVVVTAGLAYFTIIGLIHH